MFCDSVKFSDKYFKSSGANICQLSNEQEFLLLWGVK